MSVRYSLLQYLRMAVVIRPSGWKTNTVGVCLHWAADANRLLSASESVCCALYHVHAALWLGHNLCVERRYTGLYHLEERNSTSADGLEAWHAATDTAISTGNECDTKQIVLSI